MAIYMQFEGIEGGVSAKGHEKWIELNSCQFGSSRGIGSPTGRAVHREASAPSVTEVNISKECDASSPRLFQQALVGEGKKVVIHYARTTDSVLEVYLEVALEGVLVSHFSTNSSGDIPEETFSLNFLKVTYTFTPFTSDHRPGTPVPAMYDMTQPRAR